MLYKYKSVIVLIIGVILGVLLVNLLPKSTTSETKVIDMYTVNNVLYVESINTKKDDVFGVLVDDVIDVPGERLGDRGNITITTIDTTKIDSDFTLYHKIGKTTNTISFPGKTIDINNLKFIYDDNRELMKIKDKYTLENYNSVIEVKGETNTYKFIVSDFNNLEDYSFISVTTEINGVNQYVNFVNNLDHNIRFEYEIYEIKKTETHSKITYKVFNQNKSYELLLKVGKSSKDIQNQLSMIYTFKLGEKNYE